MIIYYMYPNWFLVWNKPTTFASNEMCLEHQDEDLKKDIEK